MGALPSSSSGNRAGRAGAAPSRERTLQMACSILDQAHALQLQSMGDLGRIRELDTTLAGTLMAEFSRVQLIVQEDVGKSLVALRSDLMATCSAFGLAKPPRLTAVVPPNFPLSIDKEFMLTSFHVRGYLRRASLMISGKRRQVAFCPYCGITNDNTETGLNHVRKHLDVMLVCECCHTKSVCLGQALQKHMKDNCPAVLAILGKTRGGRK